MRRPFFNRRISQVVYALLIVSILLLILNMKSQVQPVNAKDRVIDERISKAVDQSFSNKSVLGELGSVVNELSIFNSSINEDELKNVVLEKLYPYTENGKYSELIETLIIDGDWALVIVNLKNNITNEESALGSIYCLAYKEGDILEVRSTQDESFSSWIDIAPDTIVHKSLRVYLQDVYGLKVSGSNIINASASMDLKLPWYSNNNPKYISGYLYNEGTHTGQDSYAQDWSLVNNDVAAVAGGTVTDSVCDLPNMRDDSKGYGNYIQMNIGDNTLALYAHLQSCNMSVGATYNQGDKVGVSGTSGYSSGPHLHFRLRDTSRNPILAEPISGYSNIQKATNYYSNNTIIGSSCSGPTLNSPSIDYVSSSQSITFSWSGPSNCIYQGYQFRVKDTSNMDSGGTTIYDEGQGGTSVAKTFDTQYNNKDLYWGVRTANPLSPNWSVRHFRIQPTPANGVWTAKYYSGSSGWWDPSSLSNATPNCQETLSGGLDKNYGTNAPCGGMNGDDWVGDYTATVNFSSGNYVFYSEHDDGFKFWLNGQNKSEFGGSGNNWICNGNGGFSLNGNQSLRAMLREEGGDARIRLTWDTNVSVCVPPSAPSNLTAVGSLTQINLSWQDNSSDETNFRVERSPDGVNNWGEIATVSANSSSYADTGLTQNIRYYYRVKAYRSNGDKTSDYSNIANAFSGKPGDANGDNKVDGLDYITWLNHYGETTSKGPSEGDFNNSGFVDGIDYVIWLNNYNK